MFFGIIEFGIIDAPTAAVEINTTIFDSIQLLTPEQDLKSSNYCTDH